MYEMVCRKYTEHELYFLMNMQNVKAVFDAAIRVVIRPPLLPKQKEKKKPQSGCFA